MRDISRILSSLRESEKTLFASLSRDHSDFFLVALLQRGMQTINENVLARIRAHDQGWAFSSNDFIRDFSRQQIDRALSDIALGGTIRRVCRGIYDYPKFSELLQQQLSPDVDQVAQALARKFNWRIHPSGELALNLLGLSTQVPGRPIYLSDGPSRQYVLGSFTLEFKKAALKDVGFKYRESGLVVQALKALGKERLNDSVIATIRGRLDEVARKRVLEDTVTATGWVYEAVKNICL